MLARAETDMRMPWAEYFMNITFLVGERSTCLRRRVGAIAVKDKRMLATGYNGAPRGRKNCGDLGHCTREAMQIPSGQRYELCRSVHAEMNAIISAARKDVLGGTLFLSGRSYPQGEILEDTASCAMCKRVIINAGISKVICRTGEDSYTVTEVRDWIFNDDSYPKKDW